MLKGRRSALTRRRGLEEDYVKAGEMNHRAAEGSLVLYLHDDDEGQLGRQNVPELHGVGVLLLVSGRIAVITIPARKKNHRK